MTLVSSRVTLVEGSREVAAAVRGEPAPFDPIAALRSATRLSHEALDANLPLSQPGATLTDYVSHLTVIRDWRKCLSPWLMRTSLDLEALVLIESDLQDCPAEVQTVPWLPAIATGMLDNSESHSAAYCWGMTYVVEGSRLGGQVLYRRLKVQLAPHSLRYLGPRSDEALAWPDTLRLIREHVSSVATGESACAGAVAAFEILLARFRQAGCMAPAAALSASGN